MDNKSQNIIEMNGITKKFGEFLANDNINFTVKEGEVHALLGENGAGKTTLMNQLYGLYQPTEGEIFIRGKKINISDPNVGIQNGIGMVHQHFMLIQPFTVAENIILGKETCGKLGVIDYKEAVNKVLKLSEKYGLEVDPNAKICDISVGMQQRVEILKVLYRGADILIFDEPTAVLTPQEIVGLAKIFNNFKEDGKTVIIITHKLKEIMDMADRCTIIRRGKKIDVVNVAETSEKELAEKMVGRTISFSIVKKDQEVGEKVLEVNNIVVKNKNGSNVINGLSFDIKEGEIVGIAGVDGNGQTELVEALLGLKKLESGHINIYDTVITNKMQNEEILNLGIGSIPADRQKQGMVPNFSIGENLILRRYNKDFSKSGILKLKEIRDYAKNMVEKFDVRTSDENALIKNLSGGNQQKVIIAREISNNPDLLIAVQPTRGLDVGAIEFIHHAIVEHRNKGKAVLLISFELDEVLDLSDRIAVLYKGKINAILDATKTNDKEIGLLMAGGKKGEE